MSHTRLIILFAAMRYTFVAVGSFGLTGVVPSTAGAGQCVFWPNAAAISTTDSSGTHGDQRIVADDFSPTQDGEITTLGWYGNLRPADPDNPPADGFVVRYLADDDGSPGVELASFSQSAGTLTGLTTTPTGSFWGSVPIHEYSADHGPVSVEAGQCYWIEITNDVGGDGSPALQSSWRWQLAQIDPGTAPFYQGNGRFAFDGFASGSAVDGYDVADLIGGGDLAFCPDIALADPACGLETLYNTGPEAVVLWEYGGFPQSLFIGWSSGRLCSPDCVNDEFPQRRTAQALTLGETGGEQSWRVRQIFVDGYAPDAGEVNETLNFEIFARNGLDRPIPEDSLTTGGVPFASAAAGLSHPQDVSGGVGKFAALHSMHVDFSLPPGDYWLTVWASNELEMPSNFAWLTNAPDGINVFCALVDCIPSGYPPTVGCDPDDCDPSKIIMWRARHWPPLPDGFGFGSYSLSTTQLNTDPDNDPDPDPDDLYNAAFMIRGTVGGTCGNNVVEPFPGVPAEPYLPLVESCRSLLASCFSLPSPYICGDRSVGRVRRPMKVRLRSMRKIWRRRIAGSS